MSPAPLTDRPTDAAFASQFLIFPALTQPLIPFSAPSPSARLRHEPGPLQRAARAAPARSQRARRAALPQAPRGAARARGALRQGKGTGRTKGDVGGAGAAEWTRFCSPPLPCCSPSFSSSPPASAAKPGQVGGGAERTDRASLAPPARPVPVGAALLSAGSARAGVGGGFLGSRQGALCPGRPPRGTRHVGGAGMSGGPEGFWGVPGRVTGVSRLLNPALGPGCPAGCGVRAHRPGLLQLGAPGLRRPHAEGRRVGSLSLMS